MHSPYRTRFTRYIQIIMLAMILAVYLPYWHGGLSRFMPGTRWPMAAYGLCLAISLSLRSFVVSERAPVWVRSIWSAIDLLAWGLSARIAHWNMPVTLIGFAIAADLAWIGWDYRRGLWHWAPSFLFVLFGPVMLGGHLDQEMLANYIFPVTPGCVLFYLLLIVVGRMYEEKAAAEHARTEVELANLHLREYAAQVAELAVVRERNRLAREVHDTIAHGFTSIHMQLEVMDLLLQRNPAEALTLLERIKEQVGVSLSEVRRSVHALRPMRMEERRGIDGLRKLAAEFVVTTGVAADLTMQGDPQELPVAHELCLYRAVQEGLTNAFRHGHARRARVRVQFGPDAVTVAVEDDGRGGAVIGSGGLGLVGIRERAAVLGGTVAAGTAPTGGFVLQVSLPLAGQPTAQTEEAV